MRGLAVGGHAGHERMTTHLVHAPLDMSALCRWARARGLSGRVPFDAGYALHVLLSTMFGKGALQPFRVFGSERRRDGALYAYAEKDSTTLRQVAAAAATPDCLAVLDSGELRTKPMPVGFAADQRLGFDLRVRPVRRSQRDGRSARPGGAAEVDAAELDARPGTPHGGSGAAHRERVYAGWLDERCGAAVRIERCRLAAFGRTRTNRGDGPGPNGPDATLHGDLAVTDPEAFARLVRQGVGRHKAYGYGMLLRRPPTT